MIAGGTHRVTGGERVVVSCDGDPQCPESTYLPPSSNFSLYGARELMQTLGWVIGAYAEGKPMRALCPGHGGA